MHLAVRHLSVPELTHAPGIGLRAATPDDDDFLAALYATTRADELALTGWEETQKVAFCNAQFRLQQAEYAARFPAAGHRIVVHGGEPLGRVWTAEQDDHLLVVDIAILPERRRRGVGTAVLGRIFEEAASRGLPVRVTVLRTNAGGLAFYERLDFEALAEDEVYAVLERPV